MYGLQWPPVVGLDLQRPPAIGRVFYVRSTGVDEVGRGVDPGTPLQTITYALTQCLSWRNDYIVLMNNTSAVEPAWPIAIELNLVHIIGLWGAPYPNPTLMATDDNPTLKISDSYMWVEIAGIEMGAGASNACIQIGDTPAGSTGHIWIHHCAFGYIVALTTAQDGVRIVSADAQTIIEDNIFGSALTQDGIRVVQNSTRSIFRRNIFRMVPGSGINILAAGADIGQVSDNYFKVPDNVAGEAIYFHANAGNAIVVGNRAGTDDAIPANNPFRDSSVASPNQLNAWIDNQNSATGAAAVNVAPAA